MGIDASTQCTGWCIIEDGTLIKYEKIECFNTDKDWRERIIYMVNQLSPIVSEMKPNIILVEDVPLKSVGLKTLLILGVLQGALLGMASAFNTEVKFIPVSTWRSQCGLFDGTNAGKERDAMKQKSIELVNKTYNLDLCYKSPSSRKNDDDISDAILLCQSYISPIKKKTFGKV
jgi:Holliday junction resolvasome RuvABC endonuclease subunit